MPALESQGTTLGVDDGVGGHDAIAQIESFAGPDGTASEIPTSDLDSTAHEFLMGLPDEGSVTLEIFFDPDQATHTTLRDNRAARSLDSYQITFTDATPTTGTFNAYVTGFSIRVATDEAVRATVTLRISGAITWA